MREPGDYYGALKVLCEREAERQFPARLLVIRPGNIVGPAERLGRFTYWVARMEQGGEILAAGIPLTQVQLIDVRDLAQWAIRSAEAGRTGTFTATGPAMTLTWSELLGGIRASLSAPMKLTWVPIPWLLERNVQPNSSLLFWPSQMGTPGLTELNVGKAIAAGLTFRPSSATASDTLTYYRELPVERQLTALVGFDDKNKASNDSIARERELLADWHAHRRSS